MSQPYILKKSLGQHFLHDERICQQIIAQIPKEGSLLEVGPGGGALTKYILEFEKVDFKAIEFDEEKVNYLNSRFSGLAGKLIHQDFLKIEPPFEGDFNIAGNFPYNISGPILFKILEWENQVVTVVGMFQKEVAKRVSSKEGSKDYGILSVLLQAFYEIEYLFDVPPGCFMPPPKVDSGVIKLIRNGNPYQINNRKKFFLLVKTAFNQRRKTLHNATKSIVPEGKALPEQFASKRAEQLSVGEFVELYKYLFEENGKS